MLTLDRDGRWLAVASANSQEVVILDGDTLEERHRVALSVDDSLWAMAFSPDGRLLAGGGEPRKVHVIDTDTWEAREAVPVRDAELIQIGWLPDSRTVVATGVDGTVLLFDTDRALVRGAPLPASVDHEPGYARSGARTRRRDRRVQRPVGGAALPDGARRCGCARPARSPAAT